MLRFVTGNTGKVREAREYLPIPIERIDFEYVEIQSPDLHEIAAAGAREAAAAVGDDDPIIVEDSGLFIDGIGGFPGPYSAYVEDTIGVDGVWRLAERECEPPRRARFRSVIAIVADGEVETIEGTVRGRIVAPRGSGGFGYDPIFEHTGRTFAELTTAEKNAVSHRGRALAALAEWITAHQPTAGQG